LELQPTLDKYLSDMGLEHTYDAAKKAFLLQVKLQDKHSGQMRQYPAAVGVSGDWVVVQIAVADLADAPPELSREKIFEGLLRANFMWPEVCFSLFEDKIASVAWSHTRGMNPENFRMEFDCAVAGAHSFGSIVAYASSFKPPKQFTPIYQ
jgi:hypothetical protein